MCRLNLKIVSPKRKIAAVVFEVNTLNRSKCLSKVNQFCQCHSDIFQNLPVPLFRLVCHCKTCQAFFGADYNDECTFALQDCQGINLAQIEFKSYQTPLSPIKRGKCKQCGKVACCIANLGPLAQFVMVPTALLSRTPLPDPIAHIYYDRRVKDLADSIPKRNGHLLSQVTIQIAVLKTLFKRLTIGE